jgi:hypothetical protein
MKETELELLGFEKEYTDDKSVYYYVYDFDKNNKHRTYLSMITNECSDELEKTNGEWSVSIFDSSSLIYKTYRQVKAIIDAIEDISED